MIHNSMPFSMIANREYSNDRLGDNIFKNIVQQLPVPVIIFDNDLRFMVASDRFFEESPLKKENVKIGDHWYKLIPDMPLKWRMIHQKCLKGEDLKCDEDPFPREDGSTEWWKWRIKPWFQRAGDIGGIILYVENITEKKKTENGLLKNIRSLEKSNNNLSKFAHICAHDLHQSLRTISLYTQIMQTDHSIGLNPALNKYMNRIIDAVDQMRNFIRSMLDLSHSKDKKLLLTNVCMNEVVQRVVIALKKEIEYKQAVIKYNNLPSVRANKYLITQLMQNLIFNSLKYSGESIPTIEINAEDKGKLLLFSVQDNGIGIEKKHLKKIFYERKRINPTQQQGSGLGLSHCNKIIKEHGGKIWATSTINEGTTIFFIIPKAAIEVSYPSDSSL